MSSVKERLLEFLKEERITASEFSRRMGLSPAYVASMRKSMPEEKVEKLQEIFPQLNRDWLLFGSGDMYNEMEEKSIDPHGLHKHMVPLVPSQAKAGSLGLYAEGVSKEDCQSVYCPVTGAQLAIRVTGDSMEPRIPSGTILFLEKIDGRAFIPWGSPLVLDTYNGSLVKMLYPSDNEEYVEARSYNPDYPPFLIPLESVIGIYRILYKMIEGDTF